ncbi:MAG TPA: hypothetical protein VGQ25_08060 [Gemmatimonadales bacterium]|jgi:hypothetical protein|nr:hypothetical protein [Gemmatimonadales bacterium]
MAITARLSRKLHQTLGDEAAEDLVNWMQNVETQRAELRELNELNYSRFELNFSRIDERLAGLATQADLAHLEARLERRIGDLIKWSFVFWVGAVGAIAMLAGVLR